MMLHPDDKAYILFRNKDGEVWSAQCFDVQISQTLGDYGVFAINGLPVTTSIEAKLGEISIVENRRPFNLTEDELLSVFEKEQIL